jgi:prepilin-type N-terminal cleavage/methylation domain-containing protein
MSTLRKLRKKQAGFSLVEMLIVILILAALITQLLPTIQITEQEINQTADDYNNAATLRYLSMFKAVNGVFPTGLHTGLADNVDTANLMEGVSVDVAMALTDRDTSGWQYNGTSKNPYEGNWSAGGSNSHTKSLTVSEAASLKMAGIWSLGYSTVTVPMSLKDDPGGTAYGAPTDSLDASDDVATPIYVCDLSNNAATNLLRGFESNGVADKFTEKVTVRAQTVDLWTTNLASHGTDSLIPFFVAPTVNWEEYYADWNGNESNDVPNPPSDVTEDTFRTIADSRIQLGLPASSPMMSSGSWNYYMVVMALDTDQPVDQLYATPPAEVISVFSPSELRTLTP